MSLYTFREYTGGYQAYQRRDARDATEPVAYTSDGGWVSRNGDRRWECETSADAVTLAAALQHRADLAKLPKLRAIWIEAEDERHGVRISRAVADRRWVENLREMADRDNSGYPGA